MTGAEILTRFTADTSQVDKATKNYTTGLGKLTTAFTLGNLAAKGISKAIGTITANMDGAISRFDTMNNFPKVMSNLGIGADDANKSIDKLSEKLTGLPTALNDAAMAVQRLTSKNGNVQESTDMFLALNNAILAGGAGAEIQKSALEQISQAYAKGKPDMMEWRTMLMAMPAQLKQVATAMGYVDADSLGEALRKGRVSMDTFMGTIMKLNTEGVNGFDNFETQARNATGGVATSITNMRTAITRGITNMISQIDGALKPFGGLSGVIQTIGKNGEKTFATIGKVIGLVIPKVIKLFQIIADHKNELILIGGIIASWKIGTYVQKGVQAFQMMRVTLSLLKLEMGAANTATALLKYGMTALNAVISANPITLIVVGIAALTAGIIYLWNNCEGFRNFFINMWDGFKKVVSTVVDFVKKNWKTMLMGIINPFGAIFKLIYDNCEGFRNVVNNVVNAVKGFFSNLWKNITNGVSKAVNSVKKVFSTIADFVYKNVIQPIMNVFNGLMNFLYNVVLTIIALITIPIDLFLKNVILPIANWININVIQPVINFINTAITTIQNAFTTSIQFIQNNIIKPVVDFFTNAFTTIRDFIVGVVDKIKEVWNTVSSFVWDNVLSPVINFFTDAFNTIWGVISKVIEKIKGAFDRVKNAIITAFTAVRDTLSNIFNAVANIIKTPINAIIDGINKVLTKINELEIPEWVPVVGGQHPNFGMIPKLNVGTNYVPQDTLAMIHKGEAVVPKKFNPYANGIKPQTIGSMNASTPTINVQVYNDIKQDPLGQMVSNIKTFSGGAKNDYNYGMGN